MTEIKLNVPAGYEAKWIDNFHKFEEIKEKDVTKRIKTFADAVKELGLNKNDLWIDTPGLPEHINAQMKLEIVIRALNEGWVPDMANFDERKNYPFFDIVKDKIVKDKYKTKCSDGSDSSGLSNNGSRCGLAYSHSNNAWSYSRSTIGARLALRSSDLAKYAGSQFVELYEIALLR